MKKGSLVKVKRHKEFIWVKLTESPHHGKVAAVIDNYGIHKNNRYKKKITIQTKNILRIFK